MRAETGDRTTSGYKDDYETALKVLGRLHGETDCASRAHKLTLDQKVALVSLARRFAQVRNDLRKLYYEVSDADPVIQSNTCICPCVTRSGLSLPMVIDAACTAYNHGG